MADQTEKSKAGALPDPLEKKINAIKKHKEQEIDMSQSDHSGIGVGMRMSVDFVAAIFIGVMIGYWIDQYFKTTPLFLLIFFFLGTITGFYNLYRLAKNIDSRKE